MNLFTKVVRGKPRRFQAIDITTSVHGFAALVVLTIATFAGAASWDDDSHYVALGARTGYYIVRPDSRLSYQLGVGAAPTIDTADPLYHGYGADALAFTFNHAGVLSAPASLHRPSDTKRLLHWAPGIFHSWPNHLTRC
jgi:hypothetical protein